MRSNERYVEDNKFTDQEFQKEYERDFIAGSGKMKLFDKLVPKLIEEGHKILIFSQFKLMLRILEDYFSGIRNIKYLKIDGDTEYTVRQYAIDEFNREDSDYPVFLLSTKAGGLGINLTSADTIIIFDSDFNPHNDIQALSRAHRIGQKNNLVVYRLVCSDTCEQKIVEMAQQKLMLSYMVGDSSKGPEEVETETKQGDNNPYEMNRMLKFGSAKIINNSKDYVEKEYTEEFLQSICDREKLFEEQKQYTDNENFSPSKQNKPKINDMLKVFEDPNIDEKGDENWEEMLQEQIDKEQQQEMLLMGKGMRKRNATVNYIQDNDEIEEKLSEYHNSSNAEDIKSEDDELNSLVEENQVLRKRDAKHKRKNKSYFYIQRLTKEERNEEVKAMDVDENNSDIIFVGETKQLNQNENENLNNMNDIKNEQERPIKPLSMKHSSHDLRLKVSIGEEPYPELKFDLDLVMKYTENQVFIDLITINNERHFDNFI